MFDQMLRLTGKHAEQMEALRAPIKELGKSSFFERYLDIYMAAPLVGFAYSRRAEKNLDKDENGRVPTATVMLEEVMKGLKNLTLAYQTIMLLDKEHEPDNAKRVNKALRYEPGHDPEDEALFEEYLRGGIEVLYEKLFGPSGHLASGDAVDLLRNLHAFLEEYQMMQYGATFEEISESIQKACAAELAEAARTEP